jgi:hypothetical protein
MRSRSPILVLGILGVLAACTGAGSGCRECLEPFRFAKGSRHSRTHRIVLELAEQQTLPKEWRSALTMPGSLRQYNEI